MTLPVTTFFVAMFALALVALSVAVTVRRVNVGDLVGNRSDPILHHRIRAQGNFTEYVPFVPDRIGTRRGACDGALDRLDDRRNVRVRTLSSCSGHAQRVNASAGSRHSHDPPGTTGSIRPIGTRSFPIDHKTQDNWISCVSIVGRTLCFATILHSFACCGCGREVVTLSTLPSGTSPRTTERYR